MYQQIIIVGNLGRDPEQRYTPSGKAVTNFTVAVNERKFSAETGQWEDSVTWFRVTTWDKIAEACNQYLKKGNQVMVVGRVSAASWTDKDGNARASLEVTAKEVKFLSGKTDGDNNGAEDNLAF